MQPHKQLKYSNEQPTQSCKQVFTPTALILHPPHTDRTCVILHGREGVLRTGEGGTKMSSTMQATAQLAATCCILLDLTPADLIVARVNWTFELFPFGFGARASAPEAPPPPFQCCTAATKLKATHTGSESASTSSLCEVGAARRQLGLLLSLPLATCQLRCAYAVLSLTVDCQSIWPGVADGTSGKLFVGGQNFPCVNSKHEMEKGSSKLSGFALIWLRSCGMRHVCALCLWVTATYRVISTATKLTHKIYSYKLRQAARSLLCSDAARLQDSLAAISCGGSRRNCLAFFLCHSRLRQPLRASRLAAVRLVDCYASLRHLHNFVPKIVIPRRRRICAALPQSKLLLSKPICFMMYEIWCCDNILHTWLLFIFWFPSPAPRARRLARAEQWAAPSGPFSFPLLVTKPIHIHPHIHKNVFCWAFLGPS